MNTRLLFVVALAMTVLISCATTSTKNVADWHSWSQSTRDRAILDRAQEDNAYYVGQTSKEWVKTVVSSASGGAVAIPLTNPSLLYQWQPDSNTIGRSGAIEHVQPGEIVQMKLASGVEHTAIVAEVLPHSVTFIESNANMPHDQSSPSSVFTRRVSFDEFCHEVNSYTIYSIR
ncbi:MAG: hypothetical protein ACYCZ7_01090 [Minisyncoccota bacterium]